MEIDESEKKWSIENKLLLLKCRLRHEPEFASKRVKKSTAWQKVIKEILEEDPQFPFTKDEIYRKFLNFMVTYKRIKRRKNAAGEAAATSWDYFEAIDEVYGEKFRMNEDMDYSVENLETIYCDETSSHDQSARKRQHSEVDDEFSSNDEKSADESQHKREYFTGAQKRKLKAMIKGGIESEKAREMEREHYVNLRETCATFKNSKDSNNSHDMPGSSTVAMMIGLAKVIDDMNYEKKTKTQLIGKISAFVFSEISQINS